MISSSLAQCRDHRQERKVGGRDLALTVRAEGVHGCAVGNRDAGELGRRLAVGQRPADRPALAHAHVADLPDRLREHRSVLLDEL